MNIDQPTLAELKVAFNSCCLHQAMCGTQPARVETLKSLRDRKHTWVGDEEHQFRFVVDQYLREQKCGK